MTEHSSDRVLEAKIESLSKLTDERFANAKETLVRIEKKIDDVADNGYITKAEHGELHTQLERRLESVEKQNKFNSQMIWVATGVVGTISFFSPLIFKYFFNI